MNLFDRAREHIPPAADTERMFQCAVCSGIKNEDQFRTLANGRRDEWCRSCVKYERTPPHEEVTCEGYGQANQEEVSQ